MDGTHTSGGLIGGRGGTNLPGIRGDMGRTQAHANIYWFPVPSSLPPPSWILQCLWGIDIGRQ